MNSQSNNTFWVLGEPNILFWLSIVNQNLNIMLLLYMIYESCLEKVYTQATNVHLFGIKNLFYLAPNHKIKGITRKKLKNIQIT